MYTKCFCLVLLVTLKNVLGARILGIVTTPSYSHQVVFYPLWRELSQRGHQVVLLTTNPIKDPSLTNLTEIDLGHVFEAFQKNNVNEQFTLGPFKMVTVITGFFQNIIDSELSHPEVQALIHNKTEHFDVLLVEGLEMTMSYFSERFNCPLIHMYSLEAWARGYRKLGNPTHPGLYPDFMLPYSKDLNFWQRLESLAFEIYVELYDRWINDPAVEENVRKYFGEGYPSVEEVRSKVTLMFTNTDNVLHEIRPLLPNTIPIGGGTHLKTNKPLPRDLKKQLDSTKPNGFIYFSLGSNVKSKYLPNETIQTFLQVFAELPQLVLWKFELDDLPGKPPNVIISKWLPQQDVLRHPNLRLFITQGGLQSMEEAINVGVPMIGIPFIGDQPKNVRNMVGRGLGLHIDRNSIDKETLEAAIREIINNQKFKDAVTRLAALVQDQPMTGLEKAVWWTEYVIRHKGAEHLRSPSLKLSCYKYFMVDIAVFLVTVATLGFLILKKLLCLVTGVSGGVKKVKKQ